MHQAPVTKHQEPTTKHQAQSDSDLLVRVENVGKIFCRDLKKSLWYGLKDGMGELVPGLKGRQYDTNGQPILRQGEFWSNQGINFELRRGECLGLIGHNGAGKTTLLKMLNGLIKPDMGKITMRGRVGALIALGAGFNPILTGRENVYIAGSVYGLTKAEIDAKYDEIVEFAELEDFMESPVQNYSSGMQVRLGFGVATAIEPDVLIIDEVLAVGDAKFRFKSAQRINKLLESSAVIFVSHNDVLIQRICSKALLLQNGLPAYYGKTQEAFACYRSHGNSTEFPGLCLTKEEISNPRVSFPDVIETRQSVDCKIYFESTATFPPAHVRILISNETGEPVLEFDSLHYNAEFPIAVGENTIELKIPPIHLQTGTYQTSCVLHHRNHVSQYFRLENAFKIEVSGDRAAYAPVVI